MNDKCMFAFTKSAQSEMPFLSIDRFYLATAGNHHKQLKFCHLPDSIPCSWHILIVHTKLFTIRVHTVLCTFRLRQQSLWTWVSVNRKASWIGLPKSATSKMQTSGRKTVDLPLRLIEPIERSFHRSHHQREQVSLPPIRKSTWYRTHQPPARYCPID